MVRKMVNKEKEQFKVLDNGDVEGSTSYPKKDVSIKVAGREVVIGYAPEYEIKQIIHKDKIKVLLEYLNEQKDYLVERLKKNQEVLDATEAIDIDKVSDALTKLPMDSSKKKKYPAMERLVQEFYMKSGALKNKPLLDENIKKIDEQIEYLSKLV